ncbi:MAG: rhomboid family intramembrane serine protease [Actinobacteria bacterium]|nr:rhomboid family intramembrane serine protease [Actinomycetota bacterium]
MSEEPLPAAPAPAVEVCYRHPGVQTRVHCTRCGRPICPDCMIQAPVGFQCPECVADARREFKRGPGRALRGGFGVTQVLLAVILGVFVLEVVKGGPGSLLTGPGERELFDLGAMYPPAIAVDGQYWRLFTAMFLHAGLLHLGFNAYALWLFGRQVESAYGRTWMLLIYLVSGFLATVASYAFGPISSLGVGASGAIFGIFGAFIAYNYRRRHLALAAANLRMAMTLILLNLLLAFGFERIDWRAHLGGLVVGFLAGYVAEGFGSPAQRRAVQVLGVVTLLGLGLAVVVWRTNDIRSLFGL